jgi:hypothetical protein
MNVGDGGISANDSGHDLKRRDLEIIAGHDRVTAAGRWISVAAMVRCSIIWFISKNVDGRGIELSQAGVNSCVAHGLSVIQGDADTDLAYYPDRCVSTTLC